MREYELIPKRTSLRHFTFELPSLSSDEQASPLVEPTNVQKERFSGNYKLNVTAWETDDVHIGDQLVEAMSIVDYRRQMKLILSNNILS